MGGDGGCGPITRNHTKQNTEKDYFGGPSDMSIDQLPTKRDILKYMRKIMDENQSKHGYKVREIVQTACDKIFYVWERAITDRDRSPLYVRQIYSRKTFRKTLS